MPSEFFGWFLLNQCMHLEPSDVATIKAKAESYELTKIENAIKMMWSGGGLAQKDQERKKMKTWNKNFMAMEERGQSHSIYEVEVEREDQVEEEDEEDSAWSQFDDLAAAVLEDPENEQLLTAFQDMKKKLQYRDARKMLAKSRIARDYYPVEKPKYTKPFKRDGGKDESKVFHGDCMRCGKYGHRARDCPQKKPERSGKVNFLHDGSNGEVHLACEKGDASNYMVLTSANEPFEPIFAVNSEETSFCGILDSGASETIIGVDTLQELYECYERLGFEARKEIEVDRSLHKSFVYGNGQANDALGLAKINIGLLGKETTMEAHVVEGSTPLLLSSRFLYDHDVTVNFKKGWAHFAEMTEHKVQLVRAPSFHLMMSILQFPGSREKTHEIVTEAPGHVLSAELPVSDKRPTDE